MSKYAAQPIDFAGLKTVPLQARGGKVRVTDFATRLSERRRRRRRGSTHCPICWRAIRCGPWLAPSRAARAQGRAIIWGLGGHVIKCGLAPVLIDLMQRGYATAFAMNGAASIHDFEIALAGHTSEDVEAVLPDGRFGAAEETGREMNEAIGAGARDGLGMGEALGRGLDEIAAPEFAPASLVLQAWRAATPVTVHVAIGTDTPHMHPAVDAAAMGSATHRDFRLLCSLVAGLHDGGVYLNVGSAVVLPEVFLKAVSAVRNLGHPLAKFTTVNLDFLQHYRPKANVVERPHAQAGGAGYSLTGHHELMVPLLAACLIESEA